MKSPSIKVLVLVVAFLWVLAGCAAPFQADPPGPAVPRISQLEIVPERVKAGCPAIVRFHFEDSEGDVVWANAHWSLQQSNKTVASGYLKLPIEPPGLTGKISGEARARITLERYGTYWYHVQVEDAAGHKSNILRDAILVDAPLPWRRTAGECDLIGMLGLGRPRPETLWERSSSPGRCRRQKFFT